ncbi:MAG: hypothetical protein J5809_06520 [Selenomonadaceae bacterium]|nr:hypothetical protein [Selenomonadaceae bacterium]
MNRKFLATLVLASSLLISENCFAEFSGENNPALIANMTQNRANYINCGAENISWQIDKTSLNVMKYEPPEYIIAVNLICTSSNGLSGTNAMTLAKSQTRQYRYNYNDRRIYVKRTDDSGAAYWIFIDPKVIGTPDGYKNDWDTDMAAGEIAFYLAYGMSFFDKPVSKLASDYIKK